MCEIATMLAVASAGVGAMGAMQQASASEAAHRSNEAMLRSQAVSRENKAAFDADASTRKFTRIKGETEARIGATGIAAESFGDIFRDDSTEAALEREAIRSSARSESSMLKFRADSEASQASSAKQAGIIGAFGAVLNAGSSIVKGSMRTPLGESGVMFNTGFALPNQRA